MAQTYCKNGDSLFLSGQKPARIFPSFLKLHIHNMGDSREDFPIFKILSLRNLSYLLTQKHLFLDRIIEAWEDPYELFFLKEDFWSKSNNCSIGMDSPISGTFGQSWSLQDESDAMWRIYSTKASIAPGIPDIYSGIRIQTSFQKILNALYYDDDCMGDTWLGNVEYGTESQMIEFIKEETKVDSFSIWRDLMPYTMFIKRSEFSHEKEFRVIKLLDSSTDSKYNDIKRIAIAIEPDSFIDSYMLDPRLSQQETDILVDKLVKLGADRLKIKRSELYDFKRIRIELD